MAAAKPECGGGSGDGEPKEYDLLLHVLGLCAGFPVAAKKIRWLKVPPKVFFACKHFGTGVLIATAFVHLLPTAFGSLGDPCLPDLFTKDYPPLPGVIMMGSLFVLFVIEMWLNAKAGGHSHGGPTGMIQDHASNPHAAAAAAASAYTARPPRAMSDQGSYSNGTLPVSEPPEKPCDEESDDSRTIRATDEKDEGAKSLSTMPGWFGAFYEHSLRQHAELVAMLAQKEDGNSIQEARAPPTIEVQEYAQQDEEAAVDAGVYRKMSTHVALLEGGILFHSVFVGMTVSITIDGFVILLIAILFHQMFEGLGLGSRIAAVPYPKGSAKPWLLVFAFGTTAPIGQAIGLLTRNTYDANSALGLIIVGIFNAISAGLLIYAALVDLLAEDFLSEEASRLLSKKDKMAAFSWVLLGAIGMSVVGAFA
ncbi:hypothetical protein EsDP_00002570 [Epichloe bromicola]|uniref:Uncharacterized protein n=1 Tax=Epichloe bromicola TaxID=79588 RepID=A0ABQ0CL61_9HYPO